MWRSDARQRAIGRERFRCHVKDFKWVIANEGFDQGIEIDRQLVTGVLASE